MKPPESAATLLARLTGHGRPTPGGAAVATPAVQLDHDPAAAAAGRPSSVPEDGAAGEAQFWRARAAGLEAELEIARTRLLHLARHLPLAVAEHLGAADDRLADLAAADDLLDGWVETTTLWPSSVSSELARLWSRLRRDDV